MRKIELNKDKIRKIILSTIITLFVIAVAVLSYFVYFLTKQNEVVIIPENNFYVEVGEDKNLDKLALKWVNGYIGQYMQEYIKPSLKLKNLNIESVEILDQASRDVLVNFNVEASTKNEKCFYDFGGIDDNKIISCQWVLRLETLENDNLGKNICFVTRRIRPSGYNLEQDIVSGQVDRDQEYYQFMNKKKYEDINKECTYKIENNSLYLTYDYSKTWQKFEVSGFEKMFSSSKYKLDEVMYQISSNLTYIYYDHKVAISKDKGITWSIVNCENKDDITYTYFADENNGYIITSADYAMGEYAPIVYETTNAGLNWKIVNDVNNIGWLRKNSEVITFNKNLTFIVDPNADDSNATLLVSYDAFKSFNKVTLPEGTFKGNLDSDNSKWFEIYDTPEVPKLKDNILTLVVGQGSDGDYEGGSKAAYTSKDMGKTWEFIEEFKPASEPWEG